MQFIRPGIIDPKRTSLIFHDPKLDGQIGLSCRELFRRVTFISRVFGLHFCWRREFRGLDPKSNLIKLRNMWICLSPDSTHEPRPMNRMQLGLRNRIEPGLQVVLNRSTWTDEQNQIGRTDYLDRWHQNRLDQSGLTWPGQLVSSGLEMSRVLTRPGQGGTSWVMTSIGLVLMSLGHLLKKFKRKWREVVLVEDTLVW